MRNAFARQADHALHVVRMIVEWKFEDDDVAAADIAIGQKFFVPRAGSLEDEFVHEDVVADQQRRFHRARRNFEGLHDEGGAEERQQHRHQQHFQKFGQRRCGGS